MVELRLHGRGGQGVVVASRILAEAAFRDGWEVQTFPTFGVERRGAPVAGFVRLARKPIRIRCAVRRPQHVVVLDRALPEWIPVDEGLQAGGTLLLNQPQRPADRKAKARYAGLDATEIARKHGLGTVTTPIVSPPMLGALAKLTGLYSLASLEGAIAKYVPARVEQNQAAAREGYERVEAWEIS